MISLEDKVFCAVATVMGIRINEVNCQTVIPDGLRKIVLIRVAIFAEADVFIDSDTADLTVGRILEEIRKQE